MLTFSLTSISADEAAKDVNGLFANVDAKCRLMVLPCWPVRES